MREGTTVKGLTTAASLWTVACLGIASGFGYYPIALCGMVFMLITLTILEIIQHHLPGRSTIRQDYALECTDLAAILELMDRHAHSHRAQLHSIRAQQQAGGFLVTFQATFSGRKKRDRFFCDLASEAQVQSLHQRKEPV
jgi:putative Mg2+ transporter-C (MgtC) family protein